MNKLICEGVCEADCEIHHEKYELKLSEDKRSCAIAKNGNKLSDGEILDDLLYLSKLRGMFNSLHNEYQELIQKRK